MTIKEYIEKDLPFYHISGLINKDSILKNGLKPMTCNAICVVRSNEQIVWDNIIATQIPKGIKQKYVIFKLIPSKHGIAVENIAEDSISEPTTPLHNYIADIPRISVDESDIVTDSYIGKGNPAPVPDELIVGLEGYTRKPIPDISKIPEY
ncbi:MAG: hypothetical protein IKI06_09865 [Prevotella sp.]|nr:hypothetical protein [Prevotella sp.]